MALAYRVLEPGRHFRSLLYSTLSYRAGPLVMLDALSLTSRSRDELLLSLCLGHSHQFSLRVVSRHGNFVFFRSKVKLQRRRL